MKHSSFYLNVKDIDHSIISLIPVERSEWTMFFRHAKC